MNTNTLQNYVSPQATTQITGNIINVTSGQIVPGGRIARHWKDVVINHKRFFRTIPEYINKGYMNDPSTFVEYFKLHSVEFGNWLNQEERRQFLAAGADCLIQLAEILHVPHGAIGLNRKLSISFGARGIGGVQGGSAHYEREPFIIINITKPHAEYGSFAHEYGHAIDNLVSIYITNGKSTMVSLDIKDNRSNKYNDLMDKIFKIILGTSSNPTKYMEALEDMSGYWKSKTEIWARLFETALFVSEGKQYNKMFYGDSYKSNVYAPEKSVKEAEDLIFKFVKNAVSELSGMPLKAELPKHTITETKGNKGETEQPKAATISSDEDKIYKLIEKNDNITIDEIIDKTEFSLPQIQTILLQLDIKGLIKRGAGNTYNVTMDKPTTIKPKPVPKPVEKENTFTLEQARELGKKAFKKGKKLVPAQDEDLVNALEGFKVGTAAKYLDAWQQGYIQAQLEDDEDVKSKEDLKLKQTEKDIDELTELIKKALAS